MSLRIRAIRNFAILAIGVSVFGCATSDFTGDGKLIDHGPFSEKDRYVIDLGAIDLTRVGSRTYTMSNLPSVGFVIGVEFTEAKANRNIGNRPAHSGRIRVILETSNHEIVVDEEAALNSWKWSYWQGDTKSFLYRVGQEARDTLKNGAGTANHLEVRSDYGRGTYFFPVQHVQYKLTLDAKEAQASPQRPARLLLKGGGWK